MEIHKNWQNLMHTGNFSWTLSSQDTSNWSYQPLRYDDTNYYFKCFMHFQTGQQVDFKWITVILIFFSCYIFKFHLPDWPRLIFLLHFYYYLSYYFLDVCHLSASQESQFRAPSETNRNMVLQHGIKGY